MTEARTLTITDFLLARIAEDEDGYPGVVQTRRDLAEATAKKRIVHAATAYSPELEHGDNGEWAFDLVLREIAAVYDHHRDYRSEWRP